MLMINFANVNAREMRIFEREDYLRIINVLLMIIKTRLYLKRVLFWIKTAAIIDGLARSRIALHLGIIY